MTNKDQDNAANLPGIGSIVAITTRQGEVQTFKLTGQMRRSSVHDCYHGEGYRFISSRQQYSKTARGFAATGFNRI